jgi:hypothetical protein
MVLGKEGDELSNFEGHAAAVALEVWVLVQLFTAGLAALLPLALRWVPDSGLAGMDHPYDHAERVDLCIAREAHALRCQEEEEKWIRNALTTQIVE